MKKGILLINLGTPEQPDAKHLRPYLRKFLGDKRVIDTPDIIWKPILELMILPKRPQKSAALYQEIWSDEYGSPLKYYTERQRDLLQALNPDASVKYAFSYSEPSIPHVLAEFEAEKITDLRIIALYPQYSTTTVGSVNDAVMKFFHRRTYVPNLRFVTSFYEKEAYLDLLASKIKEKWDQKAYDKLVISYHGIPKSYVDKGDPYEQQCQETTAALKERLPEVEMLHTYQSKFGPAEWLTPAFDQTIAELPKQGTKKILVVSPSFVSDCLETLHELEIENAEVFTKAGGELFDVVPCLNDDPQFIALLNDLVK
ncbi:ferrochelatase [Ligilactobacillus apodemi]|uniref:ferrochelatase n=1 Tax=Ligilactobacillus apodemi TaxID=307126 RepID=UPI0019B66549|nr:ferrochelatase [Ligilactobacillus apodemi]MBD5068879.1 ferrochelatase [Lactobacillus sp.]MCR1901676.1 ferrochelatase [Ligilactobacillus apodemi]